MSWQAGVQEFEASLEGGMTNCGVIADVAAHHDTSES